jgi:hypothetical protein
MAEKTKFFRVATSGATTDGRTIEPQDILDIVATFNREALQPRVNMEHIRGYSSEPPFCAYGDIVAVEARDVELTVAGTKEKRKALYAQIEPTAALKALAAAKQKIFTSIEFRPNFAGSGKAGLVGLAVTDNPASFGTEALSFSAKSGLLTARKEQPEDLFAEGVETQLEFEPEAEPADGAIAAFKSWLSGLVAGEKSKEEKPPVIPPAPSNDNFSAATFAEGMTKLSAAIEAQGTAVAKVASDLAAVTSKLEGTEAPGFNRQPASGGGTAMVTDC